MASAPTNDHIRYEPDEKCSLWLSIVVGAQGIMLVLAPTVLIVAITVQASGQGEELLSWYVFAALIIVGVVTALQASRLRRFGAGHLVITGATPNYIAVSVLALEQGGPPLLASLIVASALFFFAIATWLSHLRRVITPTVSGTMLMLIAATIVPFGIESLTDLPEGGSRPAALAVAAITILASTALALRAPRSWRPWSLIIGIAIGCGTAAALGIYELDNLYGARWVGLPDGGFPGLHLTPDVKFWALLPMFLIVTLVQSIKSISDSVAIQRVSRRRPRATDFRLVQGSIHANAAGTMLSGLAGTPPTSLYSSFTASLVNLTGVAARSVGYTIAIILIVLAFSPKLTGALLTIPSPVMGAFLLIALGVLFVEGLASITRSGLDPAKAFVIGLSLVAGLGLQSTNVFSGILADPWDVLFGNGITAGAATAIGLTVFLDLTSRRPRRMRARLDMAELPAIDTFLRDVAAQMRWDEASTQRLRSAGEETLTSLLQPANEFSDGGSAGLLIVARPEGEAVELEFVSSVEEENLGDHLAYLGEQEESADGREMSFRLLRHYASTVSHQKYHGTDIVTVRVDR